MERRIHPAMTAGILAAAPAAWVLTDSIHTTFRLPAAVSLFVLLVLGLRFLRTGPMRLTGRQAGILAVFSLLLALVVLLGRHIHVEDPYAGLAEQNYILPYTWWDLFRFLFLGFGLFVAAACLFCFTARRNDVCAEEPLRPLSVRRFCLIFLLLFLTWLPYLLRYAPGFILGDSLGSIRQALNYSRLDNRNPVLYTLLIRLCLFLSGAFSTGDVTGGCFLYSLLQMLFVSACLAYLIEWLCLRFRLRPLWRGVLIALYGLSPYVAQNSIAMWKDPIFSAAITVWTLLLFDFCRSRGTIAEKRGWRLGFTLITVLILFSRNNGITAVALTVLFLFPALCRGEKAMAAPGKRVIALLLAVLVLWGLVTGPGYRALNIGGIPREESVGMMLNQMARVAVYGGEMSEADRAYLDSVLPIEEYPTCYRPCCIDLLKWDPRVNTEALYSTRFYITWASLLLKNPRIYLEAWELNSYGFWTVNRSEINTQTSSISAGEAYNLKGLEQMEIGGAVLRFSPLLKGEPWERLPYDAWSPPLGILNWLLLFTALALALTGRRRLLPALAPCLGIAMGLLLGTPIWYLARYELPLQLLLPLLLLLLFPCGGDRRRRIEIDHA